MRSPFLFTMYQSCHLKSAGSQLEIIRYKKSSFLSLCKQKQSNLCFIYQLRKIMGANFLANSGYANITILLRHCTPRNILSQHPNPSKPRSFLDYGVSRAPKEPTCLYVGSAFYIHRLRARTAFPPPKPNELVNA